MAKNPLELGNELLKKDVPGIIYPHNKEAFLKKHGLDKLYEFDGGDLVDRDDMSTTTVRVNDNGIQEDYLLDQIGKLGKWDKEKGPKRSDIQVWRDRAKKYGDSVGDVWPLAKTFNDLTDDDIQELIDVFGFDRKGEW